MSSSQPPPSPDTPLAPERHAGDGARPAVADPAIPRWNAGVALIGLVVGLVGSVLAVGVFAAVFAALGTDDLDKSVLFGVTATAVQGVVFVIVALSLTSREGRTTLSTFGLRAFPAAAWGWAALTYIGYLVLVVAYSQIVNLPDEQLPFGENPVGVEAVLVGVMLIAVAPPVEEFFFRGFIYQGLRRSIGVPLAAIASGALFGLIHLEDPAQMGVLAILGIGLALLFQKTGSLWPCIAVHAVNNTLAFIILMTG